MNPAKNAERANGPRLVSLSYLLPYAGVDHAGGELLLNHYRLLAQRCARLDAFAIDFDENSEARGREADILSDSYQAVIIDFPFWRKTMLGKLAARLWHLALPVLPDVGICVAFASSATIRECVRNADIVELQWFEYFYFARLVKRINPTVRVIGFVHDIPSQRLERQLSRWPRTVRHAYVSYAGWLERKVLRRIDSVTVLSDKDASLVALRLPSIDVAVLHPPLEFDLPKSRHGQTGAVDDVVDSSFGFIGAFHRPENHDAAMWLLSEIWPGVLTHCPGGRLYLVGSRPSIELQHAASRFGDSVIVTGYVDDIDEFYDRFSTVVIPLRYGAGVKFKTISGILAGKNIVATPVAIEGTLSEDYFFRISESADTLAQAMVEIAHNPEIGRSIAESAREAVGSRYSRGNYAKSMTAAYQLEAWPRR